MIAEQTELWTIEESLHNIEAINNQVFEATEVSEKFTPNHMHWPWRQTPPFRSLAEKVRAGSRRAAGYYKRYFEILGIEGVLGVTRRDFFILLKAGSKPKAEQILKFPQIDHHLGYEIPGSASEEFLEIAKGNNIIWVEAAFVLNTTRAKRGTNLFRVTIPKDNKRLDLRESLHRQTKRFPDLVILRKSQDLISTIQANLV